jgi:hypothetical protein
MLAMGRISPVVELAGITKSEEVSDEEKDFPSVGSAYDFVLPSYQWVASRFEAADTRLTALLTLTSTVTLAVPLFAKNVNEHIRFSSPLFLLGMIAFLIAGVVGVIGRIKGKLVVPNPGELFNHLDLPEWEFRKNQIFYAGENFNKNKHTIATKGRMTICVTIALLAEVVLFTAWIMRG